jgi:pimeloyl-ACP methyl ester carboxylesterase
MTLSSSLVDVKGRPTQILAAGDGEQLVFLHGGGIIEGFDCFEPLAERFRVIAPLAPGYGETELDPPVNGRDEAAGHVRDVLDALGIERTVLVGHSLGGWLAASVAARFPDRIGALVLGAPYGMDVPEHRGADMLSMT